MYYFDTETCGFYGPCVLIQWAKDDGNINLHSVWTEPIYATLTLIEEMMKDTVVGFNLAFDMFHLNKIYNMLSMYPDYNAIPRDIIDELAELEEKARDGKCLKPAGALDLMLHARKGPYQSTMDRKPIKIKKVPKGLAYALIAELTERIPLKDIYFDRSASKRKWHVVDIEDEEGNKDPDFVDVVLKFNPSSALKALAVDLGLVDEAKVLKIDKAGVNKAYHPVEYGYAPFAMAGVMHNKKVLPVGPGNWKGTWPSKIMEHIIHWGYNSIAREYAEDDVHYTREVHRAFGNPEPNDDDSILACAIAAIRWKGFKLDLDKVQKLKDAVQAKADKFPWINSPKKVLMYLHETMSPLEQLLVEDTKAVTLNTLIDQGNKRALEIKEARAAVDEIKLYNKLLHAGRFHPSFKIIGTLSTRMSGADGLNPQGIKRTTEVRECFPMAFEDEVLGGGDFDAFEVCLADAEYKDAKLHEALINGKKFHALFGVKVFKGMSYDDIIASQHTEGDKYTKSKNAVFAMLYGGDPYTLQSRLGVSLDVAEAAYKDFTTEYSGVGEARKRINKMFNTLKQEGLGGKVEWKDPADYIESMFGFRRYFTLENMIVKALYELAQDPPKSWLEMDITVKRRSKEQKIAGAVQSALFGAAFTVQGAVARAALNHRIQSSGAQITKYLQRRLWDLQPSGINDWLIRVFQVHDECETVSKPELVEDIKKVVENVIEEYRPRVPLIKMEWKSPLKSWADK